MLDVLRRLVGRFFVPSGEDVGSLGVADVAAAVGAPHEAESGAAAATGADAALHVVPEVVRGDMNQSGEPFLDLAGLVGFDHVRIEPPSADGSTCPLEVGIEGRDVVLIARSERLGVLLSAATARALALSLMGAAEEVIS